ncbi:M15 family metallopeptidase [Enterococcus mediterraneensis]|uniref:M15 family metallopeptidase n=1 Tax=Enterococcus mediterraneensis TaxID=2364791 RepID=UPI001F155DDE|nr:M15 family metallopeptidase [Enterococcus mediterraneensis]
MKKAGKVVVILAVLGGIIFASIKYGEAQEPYAEKTTVSKEKTAQKEAVKTQAVKQSAFADLPDVSVNDWQLVLVSPDHHIKKEVSADQLVTINGGQQIDRRIEGAYNDLVSSAKKAGINLRLISAFRSVSDQEAVFSARIAQLMSQNNLSEADAKKKAMETMTEPGFSEHHTGLAIDVVDEQWLASNPNMILDESYSKKPGAKWLQANAYKYGFIVRYPDGKEDITKITYEPWHLRYVGKESAAYIEKHHITLEEYIQRLTEK